MKIVFLDAKSIGDDIDLSIFEDFGEVIQYTFTTTEEAIERTKEADIIIDNKVPINASTIGDAKKLKLVCVTATGTNNLDKPYLEERGIAWRNVAGYSTVSVAQHTFAMLFYLYEHLAYYDHYVKSEQYAGDTLFTHFDRHFCELKGKTWGIIGLGNIGSRVAEIATVFGCHVIYYSASGNNNNATYEKVDLETLLADSDILSIHAPLKESTENLINAKTLKQMKSSAILLNLGRGPIVNEEALVEALENQWIAAAGLDVLKVEPMLKTNPLIKLKDSEKLLITPHIGWASVEARNRLMQIIYKQIETFFA